MKTKNGVALLGVALLAAACDRQPEPTGADFRDVPADMIMTDMVSYVTNAGIRKARLNGDTAHVFEDSSAIKVKGVKLVFFDEQGVESGSLTSRLGNFNTATQAMVARGNVVLVTKVGNRRIETEELFYDPQSHKLWSTVKTLMIEGGSRVTGDGFNADDKFENVDIKNMKGRVEGKLKF